MRSAHGLNCHHSPLKQAPAGSSHEMELIIFISLDPLHIVQAARSHIKCSVPFAMINQFKQALIEPLGGGNIPPNRGWTFAQLRGVPTSDREGMIFLPNTLLTKIHCVPFFMDAIFCSMPHWQASLVNLAKTSTSVVQLAFIDKDGSHSVAAKAQGVGMFGLRMVFFLMGSVSVMRWDTQLTAQHANWERIVLNVIFVVEPTLERNMGSTVKLQLTSSLAAVNDDGFMTVGKKLSKSQKQKKRKAVAKVVVAGTLASAMPADATTASGSKTHTQSNVKEVLYPEGLALVMETINAFYKIAYDTSNGLDADLHRALSELKLGWGLCTSDLDNLFCLPSHYAVIQGLPLTVAQVEDKITSSTPSKGKDHQEAVNAI
ncbi:hypothetical protein BJY52DRAFT_1226460 [Lactarius psammicola]|nr:hypothetical protein BJY52DRAFT_1226460 [Lactarius psammicola]